MIQLQVARLNFFRWRSEPKYLVAVLYLILYTYSRVRGMADYARALGSTITPWLLPFLPGSGASFVPLILAFVLLIADAPFRTGQQKFVILRTGKRAWICGQLLYLLAVSVGFTLLLWVLSWLWLLPELTWSRSWGAVLTTSALTGGHAEFGVYLNIKYDVMKNTDPIAVTAWCMAAMTAVCYLLGVIMAACNLWLKKGWGTIIVSALVLMSVIPSIFSQEPGMIKKLLWISPVTWTDRSLMGHVGQGLPSYSYAILAPLVLGTGLSIWLVKTIHRNDLETTKE